MTVTLNPVYICLGFLFISFGVGVTGAIAQGIYERRGKNFYSTKFNHRLVVALVICILCSVGFGAWGIVEKHEDAKALKIKAIKMIEENEALAVVKLKESEVLAAIELKEKMDALGDWVQLKVVLDKEHNLRRELVAVKSFMEQFGCPSMLTEEQASFLLSDSNVELHLITMGKCVIQPEFTWTKSEENK